MMVASTGSATVSTNASNDFLQKASQNYKQWLFDSKICCRKMPG